MLAGKRWYRWFRSPGNQFWSRKFISLLRLTQSGLEGATMYYSPLIDTNEEQSSQVDDQDKQHDDKCTLTPTLATTGAVFDEHDSSMCESNRD